MPETSQLNLETSFTTTYCLCPNSRFGVHEKSCLYLPYEPVKPNPRAGKRAWRKYWRAKS